MDLRVVKVQRQSHQAVGSQLKPVKQSLLLRLGMSISAAQPSSRLAIELRPEATD